MTNTKKKDILDLDLINLSLNKLVDMFNNEQDPVNKEILNNIKAARLLAKHPNFNEIVWVVDSNLIETYVGETEFMHYNHWTGDKWMDNIKFSLPRAVAELDVRYRQIIPNAVLVKKIDGELYFGFFRKTSCYHNKDLADTIGMIGGHYSTVDKSRFDCLLREIKEETIGFSDSLIHDQFNLGWICEQTPDKDITRMHFCDLWVVELKNSISDNTTIVSSSQSEEFIWFSQRELKNIVSKKDAKKLLNKFDSWAKISARQIVEYYKI